MTASSKKTAGELQVESQMLRWSKTLRSFVPCIITIVLFLSVADLFAQSAANTDSSNPSYFLQTPTEVAAAPAISSLLDSPTDKGKIDDNETGLPGGIDPQKMVSPGGFTSTLQLFLLMTFISLAPSIMLMTTCFVRMIVVLGLLRQALGTQQLPPNQVLVSLSLFLTMMVMWPVWQQAYDEGIQPYTSSRFETQVEQNKALEVAMTRTMKPVRRFMSDQISRTGNDDAIWLFLEYQQGPRSPGEEAVVPESFEEVPTNVLIPAFMLSELKTAFIIGFQIYLPFIIIDMVIASVLISMGMMMLPPVLISLPFKLLLFILIDGWYLTVEMLLDSIQPFGG